MFTKEEQAELDKTRKEWEKDHQDLIERGKSERKFMKKGVLFIGGLGALVVGITSLGYLAGTATKTELLFTASWWGALGVGFPLAIIGGSWMFDRFRYNRYLKETVKSKENEILKSREKAKKKELSDTISKKLVEAEQSREAILKKVSANAGKRLAEKKLKESPSKKKPSLKVFDKLAAKEKALKNASQKERTLRETLTREGNLTKKQIMTLRAQEEKARFKAMKDFLKGQRK